MGTISLRSALISIPEESAVAYSGKALFDLFMILTLTNDMQTKIRDKRQGTRHKVQETRHKVQGSRGKAQDARFKRLNNSAV